MGNEDLLIFDDDGPTSDAEHPLAEPARKIYDSSHAAPPAPAATPTGDAARDFYGDSYIASVVDRRAAELWEVTGATEAQRREIRDTFIEIGESGLPEGVVAILAEHYIDRELAAARQEDPDAAADALDKEIDLRNEELRNNLRLRYGAKDGEQLLERAQRFVRAHPKLAKVLQEHGLGSRPDIVEGIVAHVFSTGWR
jgi:hypothetical protein